MKVLLVIKSSAFRYVSEERNDKTYTPMEKLITKYAHVAIYNSGSAEYDEINGLSEEEWIEFWEGLSRLGYYLSYNSEDDCFCIS